MMISIPLWIAEVAICFVVGIVLASVGVSVYHIVAIACVTLAFAIVADLSLIPDFRSHMDFLIFGNAISTFYMVLGGAIYKAR